MRHCFLIKICSTKSWQLTHSDFEGRPWKTLEENVMPNGMRTNPYNPEEWCKLRAVKTENLVRSGLICQKTFRIYWWEQCGIKYIPRYILSRPQRMMGSSWCFIEISWIDAAVNSAVFLGCHYVRPIWLAQTKGAIAPSNHSIEFCFNSVLLCWGVLGNSMITALGVKLSRDASWLSHD